MTEILVIQEMYTQQAQLFRHLDALGFLRTQTWVMFSVTEKCHAVPQLGQNFV